MTENKEEIWGICEPCGKAISTQEDFIVGEDGAACEECAERYRDHSTTGDSSNA